MYRVELYARVRRACHVEGMSTREASRVFGVDRKTVRKMLSFSVPPGYRRSAPPRRPKLGPFTGIIDRILEDDRTSHRKQRHTAKRIFDRLRDEYGFTGGYTIVKDYVREQGLRSREVFVPLSHSPGHAQADFGEAMAVIGGALRKIHFLDPLRSSSTMGKTNRSAQDDAAQDMSEPNRLFQNGIRLTISHAPGLALCINDASGVRAEPPKGVSTTLPACSSNRAKKAVMQRALSRSGA